ncbi:MAG: nucleoside hydrolase [Aestuariibacter sp.]
MHKTPVLFDHDGGVDDLLLLMLLLTMDNIDLKGVCITPADCFLSDATTSTLKLLALFKRTDIPVAQGTLHGINPFHYDWRAQPKMVNALPTMLSLQADTQLVSDLSAHDFMKHILEQAQEPVTVLMTGPCSNLAKVLKDAPELSNKVAKVIWMGGAVDVKGNVAIHNHDGSAEWNVYWDYLAARDLLNSGVDIDLVALNATNCLPIDTAFLTELAQYRDNALADLAGQFWATTVASIPSYEFTYFLWDVMATCHLGMPDSALTLETLNLGISIAEPNEGQTFRDDNGSPVNVALSADRQKVLDYLFKQFTYSLATD